MRPHFGRSQLIKSSEVIKTLFHFGLEFEHADEASAERFALAACCHANQLAKRNQIFERENALKRNVATRQPARFVGQVL